MNTIGARIPPKYWHPYLINLPPGCLFRPTDRELLGQFLPKKIKSEMIDPPVIEEVDPYIIDPSELPEICRMGFKGEKEWYFFCRKRKEHPTGVRATDDGFWKVVRTEHAVYKNNYRRGDKKTLIFYKNGQRTDWIMHEFSLFSLEMKENESPLLEEGEWVACRAFRLLPKSDVFDDGYLYEDPFPEDPLVEIEAANRRLLMETQSLTLEEEEENDDDDYYQSN